MWAVLAQVRYFSDLLNTDWSPFSFQWSQSWQLIRARANPYVPRKGGKVYDQPALAGGVFRVGSLTKCPSSLGYISAHNVTLKTVCVARSRGSASRQTGWSGSSWSVKGCESSMRGAASRRGSWGSARNSGGSKSSCASNRTDAPWRGRMTWMAGTAHSNVIFISSAEVVASTYWAAANIHITVFVFPGKTTGLISAWLWMTVSVVQTLGARIAIKTLTIEIVAVSRMMDK